MSEGVSLDMGKIWAIAVSSLLSAELLKINKTHGE